MIDRAAAPKIKQLAGQFKAVAIIGPRQSGKTTLARMCFPDKPFVSLENPENRHFAQSDPKGFLNTYATGADNVWLWGRALFARSQRPKGAS